MSLINDALKRVEQSLNDNSPDQKFKPPMPSYPMEPSGRNKKLFFIAVIGGTLFFSILILLLVLIFSDFPGLPSSPTPIPPTTPNPANALINKPQETNEEKSISNEELDRSSQKIEEPQTSQNADTMTSEPQEASKKSSDNLDSNQSSSSDAIAKDNALESSKGKNINEEFFEGMVNLASKAFTRNPSQTQSNDSEKAAPEKPIEENYTLSTAQETLEKIQRESQASQVPKEAPKTKIQQFIDSLAVTGVMISKDDSMALINNRVFAKNSMIDSTFKLTLKEIQPQKIILQDSSGNTYDVEF